MTTFFWIVKLVSIPRMIVHISHHDRLKCLSIICLLNFYRLVTYPIHPNSKNKPMILGFFPYIILNGLVVLPVVDILFLTRSNLLTASAHIIF